MADFEHEAEKNMAENKPKKVVDAWGEWIEVSARERRTKFPVLYI